MNASLVNIICGISLLNEVPFEKKTEGFALPIRHTHLIKMIGISHLPSWMMVKLGMKAFIIRSIKMCILYILGICYIGTVTNSHWKI